MSETYIVTAKTIDEAMAEANRKYSVPGKDVSFTILEMPKKGFLGFGAKDAKVQVTVSDEETISLDSIVAEMKGYKQKTAGGRYGDDTVSERRERANRGERPERGERESNGRSGDRVQSHMTQNPSRNMSRGQSQLQEQNQRKPRPAQGEPKSDRAEAQKPNAPKTDNPRQAKTDAPKQTAPRADMPKSDAPKTESAKPRTDRKPDENKPAREEKPVRTEQKPVRKQEKQENTVKDDAAPKPKQEQKPAPRMENPVEKKVEPKQESKAAPKSEVKAEPKAAPKSEVKAETQASPKSEAKAETQVAPKSEVKAETQVAPKSEVKSAQAKPVHTSVVREVNIISNVPLEAPDTTETKKYTPKTVEAKRDPNKKSVVREVNILSDIPASDPNASPFRSVPGWDKKKEEKTVAEEAVVVDVTPAEIAEDAADTLPVSEILAEEKIAAAAAVDAEDTADTVVADDTEADDADDTGAGDMDAGDIVAGDTVAGDIVAKFTRHTDEEALSMDDLLGALPENVREPDRKKVGVTEAEMAAALDFVNTLLRDMQIDATCTPVACPEGVEYEIAGDACLYPAVEITGEGSGILIGHHGETLDAIQCLLNLASIRKSDHETGADYVKISLDIENYRAKREETLRSLARRMAARAVKYKRNVFLEPMNAYERRIIHSELQNVENVSTHSVGTDKNRKIIITYEGPDKRPAQQNGGARKRRPEAEGDEENRSRRVRKPGGAGERKDRPRPPKPQKLPIENLPDFLANPADEPIEHLREN